MLKFGRYPEKTVPELGGEAAEIALKDAGIKIQDVEMFACGNLYQSNAMVGQRILQHALCSIKISISNHYPPWQNAQAPVHNTHVIVEQDGFDPSISK
jgi:hypothetical protein